MWGIAYIAVGIVMVLIAMYGVAINRLGHSFLVVGWAAIAIVAGVALWKGTVESSWWCIYGLLLIVVVANVSVKTIIEPRSKGP